MVAGSAIRPGLLTIGKRIDLAFSHVINELEIPGTTAMLTLRQIEVIRAIMTTGTVGDAARLPAFLRTAGCVTRSRSGRVSVRPFVRSSLSGHAVRFVAALRSQMEAVEHEKK